MFKKILTTIIALLLIATLAIGLFACNTEKEPKATENNGNTEEKKEEGNIDQATPVEANIMLLNGSTGFGGAQLMSKAKNGEATAFKYNFTVEKDASNITAAIINGSADIAALPTNAASVLYTKTEGKVQILCVNTLGVLFVLSADNGIKSFADLRGKTVYCPAQNPTFIFRYLCEKNGLKVGEDITIDNTYAAPAELQTAVAAGKAEIAVIPEPMVTACRAANPSLSTVLDLTSEWDKVSPEGSLMQGCIVVRKEFADKNPEKIKEFLKEYEASVNYANQDPKGASELIVANGIFAKAPIAEKAIPGCKLCFVTGDKMVSGLNEFFKVLHSVAPASIGGKLPDNGIYYLG